MSCHDGSDERRKGAAERELKEKTLAVKDGGIQSESGAQDRLNVASRETLIGCLPLSLPCMPAADWERLLEYPEFVRKTRSRRPIGNLLRWIDVCCVAIPACHLLMQFASF
jgi:hypothetical protein